jgi:hypothetical protein
VLDDELVPGEGVGPQVGLAPTRPAPTSNNTILYHPLASYFIPLFLLQALKRPGRELDNKFCPCKEKIIDI